MFKKISTTAVLFFLYITTLAQNNVALYEDCDYAGRRYYLGVGSYKLYQMQIGNDKLSSMQIPRGLRVTLYEHDDFKGQFATYTNNINCLENGWNDNASSMVVERTNNEPAYNQNDYVTFYNDCYSNGYSQSLRPGTYYGNQLGLLKLNISSFAIYGNLRVKAYMNNENAYGNSILFSASESCLAKSYNDKIGSLVIEYKPSTPTPTTNFPSGGNSGGTGNYATVYSDCYYGGSSLRLSPGYYTGDKLGLMRYDISSIEIPSGLKAKVFINNENLNGTYYTISENSNCLSNTINNRIGSIVIEESTGFNNNQNNQNNQQPAEQRVIIYTDENYRGLSSSLLPGTYSTMVQAGFADNSLSSLFLPPGYRVILYEFENFGGKSYTVRQSKTGFIISGWNDKTSSIAVYRE